MSKNIFQRPWGLFVFCLIWGVAQKAHAQITLSASPSMLVFNAKPGTVSPLKSSTVFYHFYDEGMLSLWTYVGCSGPFTVSSTCSGPQWFSGSCQVSADYRPRQPGNDSCTIQVSTNQGGSVSIMLQGSSK